jgi:tetratricopeptide (TPR) repeat protein
MTDLIGKRLGDFEIVRELGRGGMGIVYEARQLSLNRKVALKVLAGLGLTSRALERFQREAEAAAQLHHTNIVPVYTTGEQDSTPFYAMELIDGESLDRVVRRLREPAVAGPPSDSNATGPYIVSTQAASLADASTSLSSGSEYFDNIARILADVADAVDHAHKNGVIHRDIKPSNLMLGRDGRLSVNDFGLARILEQPGMTMTGEFVGTPAYMSPEQIAAGRAPLDHRTDIYSLGATLYELLTLQRPFTGEHRDLVIGQIMHKEPRPPRKVNRKVPVDLETICLKAMEKDPDRRYQGAKDMSDDLRRFVNRFAIAAKRAGPIERLVKWARRHPGVTTALAALLLSLGAVAFFAHRSYVQQQERIAEQRQNALDKALVSAMGGDFEQADQAIAEAELLGASTGEVRMLRGQIAFFRGQYQESVDHLRQAVELLPDNVAARSLLAVAYGAVGHWTKYDHTLWEAEQLTPKTAEDFLFKGHAESQTDPGRGLATLQEAFRRRQSIMAHLLRAETEISLATDLADLGKAEQMTDAALSDVHAAKQLLRGNAYALWTSLYAQLAAADIYAQTNRSTKREEALDHAREDARALEHFSNLPDACIAQWYLLQEENNEGTLVAKLRRVSEQTGNASTTVFLAETLYRQRDFLGSLAALETKRGIFFTERFRPIVLADLDGNPARALGAYKDLAALDLSEPYRLDGLMILRLLGQKNESSELARNLSKDPDRLPAVRRPAYRRLLDYMTGNLSAEQLLSASAASRADLCFGHCYIGSTLLAEGDRRGAREHFRAAVKTHAYWQFHYHLCWVFLGRMEQDLDWPRWLPVKK